MATDGTQDLVRLISEEETRILEAWLRHVCGIGSTRAKIAVRLQP